LENHLTLNQEQPEFLGYLQSYELLGMWYRDALKHIGRSVGLDQAIPWHLEQHLVFIALKNGNY
jgi:hypothetical protein